MPHIEPVPVSKADIVSAVQKALVMTRLMHPEVTQFAADAFRFSEHVDGALQTAIEADVIPMGTPVAQAHWRHAAKAYFESAHPGTEWTKEEEAKSREYFKALVEPYAAFAKQAIKQVLENPLTEQCKIPLWSRFLPFGAVLLAALGARFLGVLPTLGLLLGFWGTWWLARQNAIKPYPFVLWGFVPTAVAGTLFTNIPYVEVLKIADKADLRNVGLGLLGIAATVGAVGVGCEYSKRDKH